VAELRRLGKRGSYRLWGSGSDRPGSSRADRFGGSDAGKRPDSGRVRGRAMFGPKHPLVRPGWWLGISAAGAAVIAVTAEFGLWFVPFAVGLLAGLAAPRIGWRLRQTVPAVLLMATVGWEAPLLWAAIRGAPAGATARVIAALAGLPPHAAVGLVFTVLVSCLQAVVGLWLGRAITPHAEVR
jgi:hypothetical protein